MIEVATLTASSSTNIAEIHCVDKVFGWGSDAATGKAPSSAIFPQRTVLSGFPVRAPSCKYKTQNTAKAAVLQTKTSKPIPQ